MSSTYQLMYLSKATAPVTQQALEQLAAREAAHNKPLGLTGVLVYSKGYFIQLLEGDQTAVRTTYNNITADNRHTNLHILHASGGEKTRAFTGQAMAVLNLDTASETTRSRLSLLCGDLNQSPNGRKVLTRLRQFNEQNTSTPNRRKAA